MLDVQNEPKELTGFYWKEEILERELRSNGLCSIPTIFRLCDARSLVRAE